MAAPHTFGRGAARRLCVSALALFAVLHVPKALWAAADNDGFGSTTAPPPQVLLVRNTLNFAVSLYNALAREPGNVVFAPYNIARAMALLHSGAQGATLAEIRKVMQWTVEDEELPSAIHDVDHDLTTAAMQKLANACVGAGRLRLPDAYGAALLAHGKDLAWARENCRGIFDVIDLLKPGGATLLSAASPHSRIMASANNKNAKRHYKLRGGGELRDMRTVSHNSQMRYFEDDNFQMVELKYEVEHYGLVIFLPKDANADLQTAPSAELIAEMLLQMEPAHVKVDVPAFSIAATYKLRKPFNEMGLAVALSANADFGAWGGAGKGLSVRDLVHRASITVDERATDAGALTAIRLQGAESKLKSTRPPKLLDTPFLFLVRDNLWGMPLVFGRVEAL